MRIDVGVREEIFVAVEIFQKIHDCQSGELVAFVIFEFVTILHSENTGGDSFERQRKFRCAVRAGLKAACRLPHHFAEEIPQRGVECSGDVRSGGDDLQPCLDRAPCGEKIVRRGGEEPPLDRGRLVLCGSGIALELHCINPADGRFVGQGFEKKILWAGCRHPEGVLVSFPASFQCESAVDPGLGIPVVRPRRQHGDGKFQLLSTGAIGFGVETEGIFSRRKDDRMGCNVLDEFCLRGVGF